MNVLDFFDSRDNCFLCKKPLSKEITVAFRDLNYRKCNATYKLNDNGIFYSDGLEDEIPWSLDKNNPDEESCGNFKETELFISCKFCLKTKNTCAYGFSASGAFQSRNPLKDICIINSEWIHIEDFYIDSIGDSDRTYIGGGVDNDYVILEFKSIKDWISEFGIDGLKKKFETIKLLK